MADSDVEQEVKELAPKVPEITSKDDFLKVLEVDPNDCKFKDVKYHPELKNAWLKWEKEGLPEKNKREILEAYNRKGEFYTEAPKLNLEIASLLTDIAKKRDQHSVETQNCVGTAISALRAAVYILTDPPEVGLNEDWFTDYISHAVWIPIDIFNKQSLARKSFITPQINKNLKTAVDAMLSEEWLHGYYLKEKVKDVKEI